MSTTPVHYPVIASPTLPPVPQHWTPPLRSVDTMKALAWIPEIVGELRRLGWLQDKEVPTCG